MAFAELNDFMKPAEFECVISGKTYQGNVTAAAWLSWLTMMQQGDHDWTVPAMREWAAHLTGAKITKAGKYSGGMLAEMQKDGVPQPMIDRACGTIVTFYWFNEEMAQVLWQTGDLKKAAEAYQKSLSSTQPTAAQDQPTA